LRRSRLIFIAVIIITALAIIWPGHAIFASATPLVLGFPLSFAWIILWVLIGFAAMLGLYLADSHDDHISGENK
jgi:membrane protein implicated in regulation of membrane protease activity